MALIKICNRIIEYSFYTLFLIVPWALWKDTSELFELNKMWLTWGLTIIIGTAWLIKMILQRRIIFQRTPLDIPIGLFLLSQIISTIFSLDSHVSLWGYYSRFNGGLLSILTYILLYYAFLNNSPTIAKVQRLMTISLISGLIVAFWGLPSHFGYDPTCLLFRGTFDVSCWTADFMPRVRIFSTLGQPAWLAAYLAILIPIAIVYAISDKKKEISRNSGLLFAFRLFLIALFYVDLLFTGTRSGFLGVWISLILFAAYLFIEIRSKQKEIRKNVLLIASLLLLITFVIGTPINQLHGFTLEGIGNYFQKPAVTQTLKKIEAQKDKAPVQSFESGGTESGNIRINVWKGAISAWKANPIFGTGVETFAFAYYKYKPAGQNLTSEWNFLYNKAHNEYLNYLATTGIFGLGSYLLMIGTFLFLTIKKILFSENSEHSENQKFRQSDNLNVRKSGTPSFPSILTMALIASYVSILVTNFFGFSVVMINIYLFMIPAFVFVLGGMIKTETSGQQERKELSPAILTGIFFILVASIFLLVTLFRFWMADVAFALGYNLDRAGEYQQAYPHLHKAVKLRGGEPVFKDEFSLNDAIIAAGLVSQKPQDSSAKEQVINTASFLATEAINVSNEIISQHPNNAVFWKTRVKLFYTLSQVDSRYLPRALDAIEKASLLAPNDANILYNLGVLYGQNNDVQKGISTMEKTIQLKPDYRDARYALGLFYHTQSLDKSGKVIANESLNKKAIVQMQYILQIPEFSKDADALKSIENWTKL